jgi:hypothetical protein
MILGQTGEYETENFVAVYDACEKLPCLSDAGSLKMHAVRVVTPNRETALAMVCSATPPVRAHHAWGGSQPDP